MSKLKNIDLKDGLIFFVSFSFCHIPRSQLNIVIHTHVQYIIYTTVKALAPQLYLRTILIFYVKNISDKFNLRLMFVLIFHFCQRSNRYRSSTNRQNMFFACPTFTCFYVFTRV